MTTRLLLAALAALSLLPAARAQAIFGVRAGLNVADIHGDDVATETDPRLGFVGGLTVTLPVTPTFSVQPELLYSMKGSQRQVAGGDLTNAADYIEVPVLLQFAAPVTETGLTLGAYVGPYAAFKVRESVEFDLNGSVLTPGDDVFSGTDFGAVGGVTVGAGAFAVDGRYSLGLTNAYDDPAPATDDVNHGVFSVSAVYRFGR